MNMFHSRLVINATVILSENQLFLSLGVFFLYIIIVISFQLHIKSISVFDFEIHMIKSSIR